MSWVIKLVVFAILVQSVSSCYFFRKKKSGSNDGASATTGSLGQPITDQAGGADEVALQELYLITSEHNSAAIRPDPDLFVRRLLLQYREEGATVAREIGRVEQYRILLGGANQDFSQEPQLTYDATSLLATYKVAEEVCQGLVAPNESDQPGWNTILPNTASEVDANVSWLAQRILGIPTSDIAEQKLTDLKAIMDTARAGESVSYETYIPACATLILDAEALYL